MTKFAEQELVTYETRRCPECGVFYAVTSEFMAERYKDQQTFYCPNGHARYFPSEGPEKKIARLEAEKTALQARVNSERDRAEKAERKAGRMEKRAAAGLCPYCNRSFSTSRLQRHIHTKHPEKAHA